MDAIADPFQEPHESTRRWLEFQGLSTNCLVCGARGGWQSGPFWEPCPHCNPDAADVLLPGSCGWTDPLTKRHCLLDGPHFGDTHWYGS